MPSRLRAYLELARLSNAPTVITNVLTGCALGAAGRAFPWPTAAGIGLAALLLYAAGMALNDAADARVDRAERPERPIPSGRVSRAEALAFAGASMLIGVAITAAFGPQALAIAFGLAVAIVAYDLLHRLSAWTVVLLGLCRALVPLLAVAAVGGPIASRAAIGIALVLGAYTTGLSLVARREVAGAGAAALRTAAALGATPLLALVAVPPRADAAVLVALGVLGAWLLKAAWHLRRRPPEPIAAVLAWLAGICLLDVLFLVLLGRPVAASVAAAGFILTLALHRRIAGT